ncbi:MAG: SUMF1/EgtB/PvdO family nonheme iron enzyme [Candidatus Coatesbacteria bacterium]|nr:SUMF1/EgtB/PvdO family nonheme iron enzyme [Candidatus Coatesbacteria bacterium]
MFCRNCGKELSERLTICDNCGADSSDPYIGWIVDNRFKVQRKLGIGGMGTVYLAYDQKLHREVAVKILPQDFAQNKDAVARFAREAVIAGQISHPNIVFIYDYGTEKNLYYIVMEYIKGERLKDFIDKNAPLPVERIREIGLQICSGLIKTHRRGIIHRDLKPSNIMFSEDGTVKIMDFGIAYAVFNTPLSSGLLGTPHYMSPEQFGGKADQRSDIYAIGVMFYQMATGELPFQAENPSEMMRFHLFEAPPSLKSKGLDIPEWFEEVVFNCLEKEPDLRFPNVYSLEQSLLKRQVVRISEGEKQEELSVTESLVSTLQEQMKNKDVKPKSQLGDQSDIPTEDGSDNKTAEAWDDEKLDATKDLDMRSSRSSLYRFLSLMKIVFVVIIIGGVFIIPSYYVITSLYKKKEVKKLEYGYLYVRSVPGGAKFKLYGSSGDSTLLQSNVIVEDVLVGEKRIKVINPGFQDKDLNITVKTGETTDVLVRLEPLKMVVNSIDDAQMSYIQDGEFIMGSLKGRKDEQPLHGDNIEGFWIYEYEVTVEQYAKFLNSNFDKSKQNEQKWLGKALNLGFIVKTDEGYAVREGREKFPILGITWFGANEYANWAKGFLPTEAQWEKAARGGLSNRTYPWGDSSPQTLANFSGLQGNQIKERIPLQGLLGPVPVGSFGANDYDVFEMAGNAAEWCKDWYQADFYDYKKGVHPAGPDKGIYKVIRGGSFLSKADEIRCSSRDKAKPEYSRIDVGFRVVRLSAE